MRTGRISEDRVVIDDALFVLAVGRHAKACVVCETTIGPGEERYVPRRAHQRRKMLRGRQTRMCVRCVDERIALEAKRSAA